MTELEKKLIHERENLNALMSGLIESPHLDGAVEMAEKRVKELEKQIEEENNKNDN